MNIVCNCAFCLHYSMILLLILLSLLLLNLKKKRRRISNIVILECWVSHVAAIYLYSCVLHNHTISVKTRNRQHTFEMDELDRDRVIHCVNFVNS